MPWHALVLLSAAIFTFGQVSPPAEHQVTITLGENYYQIHRYPDHVAVIPLQNEGDSAAARRRLAELAGYSARGCRLRDEVFIPDVVFLAATDCAETLTAEAAR